MATDRGQFNTRIGFILAAAGSAVGLGNIWKFPFEVGEGGGAAFVVIYLAFCFLLCFPVMVSEIAIGRKTNLNPVGAFKKLGHKNWAIIGFMGVLAGVLILSFYNVVAGWAFGYFLEMVQGNFGIGEEFGSFITDWHKIGLYGLVFMAVTAFIVSRGIHDGIERAATILMPTLFLMIIGLIIYAMTLDGAGVGINYYLVPDFSEITGEVVYSALGQAFFSLSLGMGALITYGSYVSKKQDIVKSAALITLTDVSIAFLAGLMIFPFVAYLTQGTMEGVDGGAGLIFATLPGVFESFGPTLGIVVGSLFFLLLCFAALTSTVSLLEVPVSYLVDEKKIKRPVAVWGMAALIFLIGIPSLLGNGSVDSLTQFVQMNKNAEWQYVTFMDFVEAIASDTFLPLGGALISFFVAYVWKKHNLNAEIAIGREGGSQWVAKYIDFAITFFCPVVLGIITVVTILDRFFGVVIIG
ncbi:sodium-dependent transporter [Kangiella profundi]|uniref:Sodium-dependent transporter n=1 Tax=Kangiella profundi TaxID=1561924 RepID=A0A2K9AUV0_9GAMM|nr:sodium-dependent transporter [Kangiella profundi]AUD78921.1 sodium-dependent transporter [Kangiella profundi]MBD3666914.1 sodium-dependent transporter [Kangiella sp.]GGF02978.1 transporter [Kangiella profundi]